MSITADTADGHRWQMPTCLPDGADTVLYWLPALGVPADKYASFASALAARGIGTVVHEWRGIGSSNRRAARDCDWNYQTLLEQDLAAGIAAARTAAPSARWLVGGHSLGGQLAALALARQPEVADGLVLLATGVPDARTFPRHERWLVAAFARSLTPLTALAGYFPGQRLGWAGREASGVMRDWARTVLSGRYDGLGLDGDPEAALSALSQPMLAITFADDRLVPAASLDALRAKLGPGSRRHEHFDDARLGARADHFRWMRAPGAVVEQICVWLRDVAR